MTEKFNTLRAAWALAGALSVSACSQETLPGGSVLGCSPMGDSFSVTTFVADATGGSRMLVAFAEYNQQEIIFLEGNKRRREISTKDWPEAQMLLQKGQEACQVGAATDLKTSFVSAIQQAGKAVFAWDIALPTSAFNASSVLRKPGAVPRNP